MFYILLGLIILALIIFCIDILDEIKKFKKDNTYIRKLLAKVQNEKTELEDKLDAFTQTYSKLDKENTLLKNENNNLKEAIELLKNDKEKDKNNEEVKVKRTRKTSAKKNENDK